MRKIPNASLFELLVSTPSSRLRFPRKLTPIFPATVLFVRLIHETKTLLYFPSLQKRDQQIQVTKMDSNLLKNLLARRENAVHELTEGFELANQLRAIINEPFGTDRSVEADDLIGKILRSFADTISMLNSGEVPDPIPANPGARLNTLGTSRRKNPSSRTRITPNLPDDGHVWRQCRRKEVLNPRYPRSYYYECTYRTSQGCQAKKLVQRTEDNPLMYQTTYTKHHTCNNRLKAPPRVIFGSTTPTDPIKSAFGLGSSKCPNDVLKDPSYPTSTKTHHPPVIISSYRT